MKTLILAAIAGVSAAQSLDNATECLTEPVPLTFQAGSTTVDLLTLANVTTGWSRNGVGADVSFDYKLWMNIETFGGRFSLSQRATHKIAIANADNTAYELQQWQLSEPSSDGSINTNLLFDKYEAAMPDSLELVVPTQAFPYRMEAEGVSFTDRAAPKDFWSIDEANSAVTDTNWWISLTRDSPGVADIATGAERFAMYYFEYSTAKINVPIDLTWAVDTSTGEDGNSTGEDGDSTGEDGNSTGEDGDSTGEDGNSTGEDGSSTGEDGDSTGEDGDIEIKEDTTSATTFGATIVAAIAYCLG